MSLLSRLSSLALCPCLSGIALAADAAGSSVAKSGVDVVQKYLEGCFTDQSQELQEALRRSADRAWACLEVSLAGETFLGFFTRRGEDKALAGQLRAYLNANPLRLPAGQGERLCRRALVQLRAARASKLIPGTENRESLAKQLTDFTRYTDPTAVYGAEWQVLSEVAHELRLAGHDALAAIVGTRPDSRELPLLTVAVRFCFRSEVESNTRLFQGLMHEHVDRLRQDLASNVDGLRHDLAAGFDGLLAVLRQDRRRLDDVFTTMTLQLDRIEAGQEKQLAVADETCDRLAELQDEMRGLNKNLKRFLDRDIGPGDTELISNESDRRSAQEAIAKYHRLSEHDRGRAPIYLRTWRGWNAP